MSEPMFAVEIEDEEVGNLHETFATIEQATEAVKHLTEKGGKVVGLWRRVPFTLRHAVTVELVKDSPQSEPEAHTPRVSETPAAGEVLRCRGCGFTANQKKPVERIEALTRHTEEKHPEVAAQWKARAP